MESRVIRLAYSTLYHSIQLVFTFYIFYHTSHTDSDIIGAVSEAPKGGGGGVRLCRCCSKVALLCYAKTVMLKL